MGLEFTWGEAAAAAATAATAPTAAASAAADAAEITGFEGFEKRLEVDFFPSKINGQQGLRMISREDLDRMLEAAECTIVSQLSNKLVDSYVLSESSLFIYPLKMVIKTCGTTKLLRCIPLLLQMATTQLGLKIRCCKYRRGSFMFPAAQPYPHASFTQEVSFLDKYFGELNSKGSSSAVMGSSSVHKWHVYVASADESDDDEVSDLTVGNGGDLTVEMCMTKLDRKVASKFYKASNESAKEMRKAAGIDELLPNAEMCDFVFDPCGYSMNSIEGAAYSTVHVTPEDLCSYASFEAMGYCGGGGGGGGGGGDVEFVKELVGKVVRCFKPAFFSVALYSSGGGGGGVVGGVVEGVCGGWKYRCSGCVREEMSGGDEVFYLTFEENEGVMMRYNE